jgi:hypothetical protein
VSAGVTVRRADPAEADQVGALTERVYRTGAHRLYERRGYLREPARDWQIRNVRLLAYRLAL